MLACFYFPGFFKFLKKIFPTTTKFFKEGNRCVFQQIEEKKKKRKKEVKRSDNMIRKVISREKSVCTHWHSEPEFANVVHGVF